MRTVETVINDAMVAPVVRGIYFTKLAFDSGNACWHTGFGNIVYNGDTYHGAGTLANIGEITETVGVKSSGVSVGLSGIDEAIVALIMAEPYLNRKAWIYFLPLDEGDVPVTTTPHLLFKGSIDNVSGSMGSTASFTVSLKSRLGDWERPRKVLYTDIEQQQLHPGDKGLEYTAQLSQKKIIWPRAAFLPDMRD